MSSPKGTAIVTGAAQGIGRAIALRLADDGFDVAVNDISAKLEQLETLVAEIKQKGQQSSAHPADVSQEEEVKDMAAQVVERYGGLDVMVANAGIIRVDKLTELSAEQWDQVLNVNARGTFLCYKYAGIQMIKQGRGGRIIGASSLAGKQGRPSSGAYSASKFAVRGLTQSADWPLAQEFGPHGITVNAYAPGAVDTPMTAGIEDAAAKLEHLEFRAKHSVPEDISNLVSFLASKESQFITGQSISINGGVFFD
ncbi:acetoin reductase family protein [Mycena pura]|uniref:Acetoin reductase family protein n=1 Tax=Mycena pura TaxID=153505 RepID=A0AAD6YNK1_9AGAR|nr:acetoin reductase family protein [Mycena pura]